MYVKPLAVTVLEYAGMIGLVVLLWVAIVWVVYILYSEVKEKRGRKK